MPWPQLRSALKDLRHLSQPTSVDLGKQKKLPCQLVMSPDRFARCKVFDGLGGHYCPPTHAVLPVPRISSHRNTNNNADEEAENTSRR